MPWSLADVSQMNDFGILNGQGKIKSKYENKGIKDRKRPSIRK